jgi:DNA-binding MarR family transcriptional regulator
MSELVLPSATAVRAARDLRVVVGRLVRRFKETHDHHEVSPSQVSLMCRLGGTGEASASELAAAERVRPQSIATTVAALEERGLITRRPDPDDGRRQLISLSDAGRKTLEDGERAGEEWLVQALQERLGEQERQTVIEAMALLERLTTA